MSSVVVTGAAGGMGSQAVEQLLGRGVSVLAIDRDGAALDALATRLGAGSDVLHTVAGDVADERFVAGTVTQALDAFGGLSGLLLAAAINGEAGRLHERATAVFDQVLAVNTRSVWLALKYGIPALIAGGGGRVVGVGSVAALRGAPTLAAYCAAKHAVVGLIQSAALEYAREGVIANVVCPGSMNTELIRPMLELRGGGDPEAGLAATVAGIPNGRLAEANELAAVATWLLLDAPPHLTGQAITVDGGRTAG